MTLSHTLQHQAKRALLTIGLSSMAWTAQAQTDVNVSVGGVIQPGIYGRVVIGTRPPPPVIYPQPVIITQAPVVVQQAPIYMHVPPGHAKKWYKHCYKYNACNQPVYFVQNDYGAYKGHGKRHKHGYDD